MDESKARSIVNKHIHYLRWALQLQEWKLDFTYEFSKSDSLDERNLGECRADPKYKAARIIIDPSMHDDEEAVLRTLLHELFHIYHADFQLLRRVIAQFMPEDKFDAVQEVIDHIGEHIVRHMENLVYDGLGLNSKGLMTRSKAYTIKKEKERATD